MSVLKPYAAKAPEVRALLAGATMLWRPLDPQPEGAFDGPCFGPELVWKFGDSHPFTFAKCPFKVGDRFFVQEDYDEALVNPGDDTMAVYACDPESAHWTDAWTPAEHLPERLSRLAFEVVGIEVRRLGSMTFEETAKSSINVEWDPRLWCWALTIKRIEREGNTNV